MRNKQTEYIHQKIDLQELYNKTILSSGLTVVSEQVVNSPYFALGFCIRSGSSNDLPGMEGTAHFMEHIAFRRTLHYTGKRLVTEFESIGAYVNAYTTKEMTCFYVLALNNQLKKCFNLLSEVVLYPELNSKDIEKERNIILEEISSYEDDPEELIFDIGEQILFKNTSYEHPIVGYANAVEKISKNNLLTYHANNFTADNMILSYSGPAFHSEIIEFAEKRSLSNGSLKNKRQIQNMKNRKPAKNIFKKNFLQSHVLFTLKTKGLSSKEKYIYAIINNILGEGLSSRLNQSLRERHGYVYSVYSTLALMRDFGTLGVYAASDSKNIPKVEELIISEFERIFDNGFALKEIKSAKEQIKSSTIIGLDGVSSKMQALARTEAVDGEYETINDTIRLIDSVTEEKIHKVIKKHLAPNKWSEVILQSNS